MRWKITREIIVNSIIGFINNDGKVIKYERVLWIDSCREEAVVFTLWDAGASEKKNKVECLPLPRWILLKDVELAIQNGKACLSIGDSYSKSGLSSEDLNPKEKEIKEIRWRAIKDLAISEPEIYYSQSRGLLVRNTAESKNTSKKYLLLWLRLFWYGGKCENALIPRFWNCGGSGKKKVPGEKKRGRPKKEDIYKDIHSSDIDRKKGVNIDLNMRAIIFAVKAEYLDKVDPPAVSHAFNEMNRIYFSDGTVRMVDGVKTLNLLPAAERPTIGQFRYWVNEDDKEKGWQRKIITQKGEKEYLRNYRPLKGESKELSFGPGHLYQVDWTMADIYLVNKFNRLEVMKRPIVYVVIDVFSRMIAGIWVTYENASWLTAAVVIENAGSNKEQFCRDLGLSSITDESWPCNKLPLGLLADRGEFYTHNSNRLTQNLGINIINTSPYRADSKGIVEQMFRKVNLKAIHLLPGMVPKNPPKERPHCALNAKLDITQFAKILIKAASYYNNYHWLNDYPYDLMQLQSSVPAIPIELWRHGLHRASFIHRSSDDIKCALFPSGTATVTRLGLKFQGLYYFPKLPNNDQKFPYNYGEEVTVIFDPRNTNTIFIKSIQKGSIVLNECCLLQRSNQYRDCCFEDVLVSESYIEKDKDKHKDSQDQGVSDLNEFISAMEKEADQLQENAISSQSDQVLNTKNRKENTKKAIEQEQKEAATKKLSESGLKLVDSSEDDKDEEGFTSSRARKFSVLKNWGNVNG